MNISRGKIKKPLKIVAYGPEGIGKSTFASQFPNPIFIDTEDSTVNLDVARFDKPTSWTMLLQQVQYVKNNPTICQTLVVDTADWAERLCSEHICSKAGMKGIEDFGWGKGYTYLEEEFGRFLNALQDIIEIGINVVVTAHAEIKKIEQPEEIGGYDHWQLKLEKKTMLLVKEWADILLFANYKTMVINVDNQGASKGKNKAQGNQRVMYTTRTPWWDAKNRHDLPDELQFDFKNIAHLFNKIQSTPVEPLPTNPVSISPEVKVEVKAEIKQEEVPIVQPVVDTGIPKGLADLMQASGVTAEDIQEVVASKGYYPKDTPIANYDPTFIQGVLIAAWEQVNSVIQQNIKNKGEK